MHIEKIVGHKCRLCHTVYWGRGSKAKAKECAYYGIPEHILVVGKTYWDKDRPYAFRVVAYEIKRLGGKAKGHVLYVRYVPALEVMPRTGSKLKINWPNGKEKVMSETEFKDRYPFEIEEN